MTGPAATIKRTTYETARLKLAHVQLENGQALSTGFGLLTQTAAEALHVERVGVWFLTDHERQLECKEQYSRVTRQHSRGMVLHANEFPTYMRALTRRRAIVADDARTHELTRELGPSYLVPNGISSVLDAPIIRGERVVGIVCHERQGAIRPWTEHEVDFAGSVADIAALMLEQSDRLELEAALKLQAEQRLTQQKLDALGLLARSVAHDLNNVLSVFLSAIDDVRENGLEDTAEFLEGAVGAGRNLSRQLLDLGARQAREPEVCDIAKVLSRLIAQLRALATSRVRVNLDCRDRIRWVQITESDLERVAFNLVANSRDAIASNGQIDIVLRNSTEADGVPGDFVVLEISDDGGGMDARTRAHLFEPYFTTKRQGHGLGLATVYGIVKRAGGSIDVASEIGQGTTFAVALRRADEPQRKP